MDKLILGYEDNGNGTHRVWVEHQEFICGEFYPTNVSNDFLDNKSSRFFTADRTVCLGSSAHIEFIEEATEEITDGEHIDITTLYLRGRHTPAHDHVTVPNQFIPLIKLAVAEYNRAMDGAVPMLEF